MDDNAFLLTIQKADRQPWRPWTKGTKWAAKRQQTQETPAPASPSTPGPLYPPPAYTYPGGPTLPTGQQPPPIRCPHPLLPTTSPSSSYPPPPYRPTPIEPGKQSINPPPHPSPHLLVVDDKLTGQSAYLLRSIRDSLVAAFTSQMGTRQWGLIYDPNGHPSGGNDIPTPIASLPFLPPGICRVVAFWGACTPFKRSVDVTTHMVFIQLCGSQQLVASRAVDTQCYSASTDGDTMEIPRALFTRASLTFQTGTRRSFAVLISILHPGSVGRAMRRLALGTVPKLILQSIHVIRR